jgi:hypothetical protein
VVAGSLGCLWVALGGCQCLGKLQVASGVTHGLGGFGHPLGLWVVLESWVALEVAGGLMGSRWLRGALGGHRGPNFHDVSCLYVN